MSVQKKIAHAIAEADKSYLFEDYDKQASAVLKALKAEGLVIVSRTPDEPMRQAGQEAIQPGKIRPEQLVAGIWNAMLSKAERG